MFAPRWIAVVDLEALPDRLVAPRRSGEPACRYLAVRVLVRLHGAPLGLVECPLVEGALGGAQLRAAIARELGDAEDAHLARCRDGTGCPSWCLSTAAFATAFAEKWLLRNSRTRRFRSAALRATAAKGSSSAAEYR